MFTGMINTGLRVGEVTGLAWNDSNFGNITISVNQRCFTINTGKERPGFL